ncbi:MAG TPA: hypothetical protein VKE96_25835 [Vicinamibacterales bacterium]|nr:hypothetical protein [Vicinamibacterales bacterium]
METLSTHAACLRIRTEYIEMPDLKLTRAQVRRLCGLRQDVCDAAMRSLVHAGFLWETADGSFRRRVSEPFTIRRAARRELPGD